jgi:hypothetical protein
MRLWQRVDLAVQALLLLGFTVVVLAYNSLEALVTGYFVVGGWQLLGMVVQQVHGRLVRRWNFRWWYHLVVLGALMLAVSCTVLDSMLPVLFAMVFILLFAAPVMALVYFSLCVHELLDARKQGE